MEIKTKKIHFMLTGGTMDSYYEGTKDTAITSNKSIIPQFINRLKLYQDFEFTTICMKDSREITQIDLRNLTKAIEESPCKEIIITHGTYTMPDTARFLKANLKRDDQTIIVTGSMIPLDGFTLSDAPFSLGYSIAKVQELPPGFYVCMNGKVFSSDEVMKVNIEGRFSSIFENIISSEGS